MALASLHEECVGEGQLLGIRAREVRGIEQACQLHTAFGVICGRSFCTSSEASQYSERPALSMAALRSTLQLSQKVCALGLFSLRQHARLGSSTP